MSSGGGVGSQGATEWGANESWGSSGGGWLAGAAQNSWQLGATPWPASQGAPLPQRRAAY